MADSNQKEEKRPLPPAHAQDNIVGEYPPLKDRQARIDKYNEENGIKKADADISPSIPHTPCVPPTKSPDKRQR